MANPGHLEILERGVEVWNQWRAENPDIRPNLIESDLQGENFSEINFSWSQLQSADLSNSILCNANIDYAYLMDTNLKNADLSGASIRGACLIRGNLENAILKNTVFHMTDLRAASARNANFTQADLRQSVLVNTDCSGADFHESVWGSVLATSSGFNDAKNLENIIHEWGSNIDPYVLQRSGELPLQFMRGVGLPEYEIESFKLGKAGLKNEEISDIIYRMFDLRASRAIEIGSILISYSHSDSAFVDHLESIFIEKGVRFWRDVKHSTSGRLEAQIDRALRINPIVLLILSEHSINSDWVEHEAESARELEKEKGHDILCPITLDDSWKKCEWDRRLRRQIEKYNILDFSEWENEDIFERQLNKLLQGLNQYYKT